MFVQLVEELYLALNCVSLGASTCCAKRQIKSEKCIWGDSVCMNPL